jgi:5S rRNA maturation endonuclease (ribonuclease M5)
MAQCPVHEDRTPSLSLAQGDVGAVLCCQFGCDTQDILAALGLGWADLFDEPGTTREEAPRRIVAEYKYVDEHGELLFVKVRYEPKDFLVKRPDGRGGWVWKIASARRVLYRLPEVAAGIADGKTVFLVEGEKDSDRLAALGYVATCNFDGAAKEGRRTKWQPRYGDMLQGANVVIIADKDEAGEAHARAAHADLKGKAASVRIVESSVTRKGADISDHLDAGLGLDDLVPVEADPGSREGAAPEPQEPLPELPRFPVRSLVGPLKAFTDWCMRDGLHPEAAVAAGLAALVTLTGPASLRIGAAKMARAIAWIVIIGAASSGKSPALEQAFSRLREHYAKERALYEDELALWQEARSQDPKSAGPPPPRPEPLEFDDMTLEAVARWLIARNAATGSASGAVIDDELAAALESLNQYKGGRGSDRSRMLKLWTGAPLHIQRVGRGGALNEIDLYVAEPVLSIAGPLTPDNVHLIGSQGSGFRPRWLPFRVPDDEPGWNLAGAHPQEWTACIDELLNKQSQREWQLVGDGLRAWNDARHRWHAQQGDAEPDDVIEALRKADTQCYRIALVIAESLNPAAGGEIPEAAVRCAAAIVDYCADVWRYLQGVNALPSSRTEDVMNALYHRFLAWLETREKRTDGLPAGSTARPCATRAQCQRWSRLKASKFAALIAEHAERFPGCVVTLGARDGQGRGGAGGIPTVLVYAPERVQKDALSVFARTPNMPISTPSPDGKDTGQVTSVRYSQTRTPNVANTEPRIPNRRGTAPDAGVPSNENEAQGDADTCPVDTQRNDDTAALTLVSTVLGAHVVDAWPEGSVGSSVNPDGGRAA